MVTNNVSAVQTDDPVQDDINALNIDMEQSVAIQQQTATLYDLLQALIKESYTAGNPDLICMEMNAAMGDYQGSTAAEWGAQNQVQNGLNNLNTDSQTMMNNITQALEGQISPSGNATISQIYADLKTLSADLVTGSTSGDYSTIAGQITIIQALVNSPNSQLTATQKTQISADLASMAQNATNLPGTLQQLNVSMFNIYDTLANYPAGSTLSTVANYLKTIETDVSSNSNATNDIQALSTFLNATPLGIDPTTLAALKGFVSTMSTNYDNGKWGSTQSEEEFLNAVANSYNALTNATSPAVNYSQIITQLNNFQATIADELSDDNGGGSWDSGTYQQFYQAICGTGSTPENILNLDSTTWNNVVGIFKDINNNPPNNPQGVYVCLRDMSAIVSDIAGSQQSPLMSAISNLSHIQSEIEDELSDGGGQGPWDNNLYMQFYEAICGTGNTPQNILNLDPTTFANIQGMFKDINNNYPGSSVKGVYVAIRDMSDIIASIAAGIPAPTPPTPPSGGNGNGTVTPPNAQEISWIEDMLDALNASSKFIQSNPNLFTDGTGNSIIATNESILTLFDSNKPTTIWNTIAGWLQTSALQGTTSTAIQDYSSDIQSNGRTLAAQSSSSQTQMDLIVNQYKQTEGDLENFVQATLQSTLTQVHNEKNQ